jgi:hypothetical protein
MERPAHSFRLFPAPNVRDGEIVQIVRAKQGRRGSALFQGPAFPTTRQLHCEIPFSVNFAPRIRTVT